MTSPSPTPASIVETSDELFERDVIERSRNVPVVVDFWAAWCQPCKMLAPLLEQAARDRAGQFVLVKAETDHCPKAAGEFNVQSIPAVFGVTGGEVVDFFTGVLSAEQLNQWLNRLLETGELTRAARLESTEPTTAEAIYRALVEKYPQEPRVKIGLARALVGQGKTDDARQIIESLAERGFLEPEAEKVRAALDLANKQSLDFDAARNAVAKNSADCAARWQLAQALAGHQIYEEALQECLELLRLDRKVLGEQARVLMLEIFRVLPDDSELTSTYRRKLSAALY